MEERQGDNVEAARRRPAWPEAARPLPVDRMDELFSNPSVPGRRGPSYGHRGRAPDVNGPRKIDVGIVDDHPIVRSGLREFLGTQPGIRIKGVASSIAELLTQLRVQGLDLGLPGRSGLDSLAMILSKAPRTAVLIYSGFPEDQYGIELMRQGARAYLHKSCDLEELPLAIRALAAGRRYLTPSLMDRLASQIERPLGEPHGQLTDRELQVLLKLARGVRLTDIAEQLALSIKTVSFYRTRVLSKLDLASNGDLTYYALKHRLLD